MAGAVYARRKHTHLAEGAGKELMACCCLRLAEHTCHSCIPSRCRSHHWCCTCRQGSGPSTGMSAGACDWTLHD